MPPDDVTFDFGGGRNQVTSFGEFFDAADRGIDPAELLSQFSSGIVGGFTTLHVGDNPANTSEAIARNIGHLMGFVGFVPGIGAAGSLASKGIINVARLGAGRIAGKKVAKYGGSAIVSTLERTGAGLGRAVGGPNKLKSIPLFVGEGAANLISRHARKSATLSASKMFKEGAIGRDLIKGAVTLGTASGVSSWQQGVDAVIQSTLYGGAFGAAFRGIGNALPHQRIGTDGKPILGSKPIPSLSTLLGTEGSENATRFAARSLSGALVQGLPSTIHGAPIELQVYEYLMGAYFGGREIGAHQRRALEIYSQVQKDKGPILANRIMIDPQKGLDGLEGRPKFSELDPSVQEELVAQSVIEIGRGLNTQLESQMQSLRMSGLTEPEIAFHTALNRAKATRFKQLLKEGKTPSESLQRYITEYREGNIFGLRTTEDGATYLGFENKKSGGGELTEKSASMPELKAILNAVDAELALARAKAGKFAEVATDPDVAKNLSRLQSHKEIIETEMSRRAESDGRTPEEQVRDALEGREPEDTRSGIERLGDLREQVRQRIAQKEEDRLYSDKLRIATEIERVVRDHDVPESLVPPVHELATSLYNRAEVVDAVTKGGKRAMTKADVEYRILGDALRIMSKARGDGRRLSAEQFQEFKELIGKEYGIDPAKVMKTGSKIERNLRKLFLGTSNKRRLRQLTINEKGRISARPAFESGKRTDAVVGRSFLDDAMVSLLEGAGREGNLDYHQVMSTGRGRRGTEKVWAMPNADPREILYDTIASFSEGRRPVPFAGEKDKDKIHFVPRIINDVVEARDIIASRQAGLDEVIKANPQMNHRVAGASAQRAYGHQLSRFLEVATKQHNMSVEKATKEFTLDFANRLLYMEKMLGGDGITLVDMARANAEGTGQFVLNAVEFNKRMPLFATDEPRMPRGFVQDIFGKDRPPDFDGMLNMVITNALPQTERGKTVDRVERVRKVDEEGNVFEQPIDANRDGHVLLRQDVWDKYVEFAGVEMNTSGQKGQIVQFDNSHGTLLVKPQFRRASDAQDAWMRENDIHVNLVDMAVKQRGTRETRDMIFDEGKYKLLDAKGKEDLVFDRYALDPEAMTINVGTGQKPSREFGNKSAPTQLFKNLSLLDAGAEGYRAAREMMERSVLGDEKTTNRLFDAHRNNDLSELDNLNLDDVSTWAIHRIMKGKDRAPTEVYDRVARLLLNRARENRDGFFAEETSQDAERFISDFIQGRSMADKVITSDVKLTPAILENPLIGKALWDTVYQKYMLNRATRPRVKNSAMIVMREIDQELASRYKDFKAGEVIVERGFAENMRIRWKDEDIPLMDAWKEFQDAGGWKSAPSWMKSAMEMLSMRIPADSPGSGRVVTIKDILQDPGTGVIFHGKDMHYMGGADIDIDKAFMFNNLPRAFVEAYRKNQNFLEVQVKQGEKTVSALKPLASKESMFAEKMPRSHIGNHPMNMGSAEAVLSASKAAATGNNLLGAGLNAANRAKIFHEMLQTKMGLTVRSDVRTRVRGDKAKEALNFLVAKAHDKVGSAEEIANIEYLARARSNADEINDLKTTAVNVSADAANYARFKVNNFDIGYLMFEGILVPNSARFEVTFKSGKKVRLTKKDLGFDLNPMGLREAGIRIDMPKEMQGMQMVDRLMKGRDKNYDRIELGEMVNQLREVFFSGKYGAMGLENPSPFYESARFLSHAFYDSGIGRPFWGSAEGRKNLHEQYDQMARGTNSKKMAHFAARKMVVTPRFENWNNEKWSILNRGPNVSRDIAARAESGELSSAAAKAEARDLKRRMKSAKDTAGNRRSELPAQDLFDMTSAIMLADEGMRAMGLTKADLAGMSMKEVEKVTRPLLTIAKKVDELRKKYNILRSNEEKGEATGAESEHAVDIIRRQFDVLEEQVDPTLREWMHLYTMGSLRPQEVNQQNNPAVVEAQKRLGRLQKKKAGEQEIRAAEDALKFAKRKWWDTNYSRFWTFNDNITPSTVRAFFGKYSDLVGATVKEKLSREDLADLGGRAFGESDYINTLTPGAKDLNKAPEVRAGTEGLVSKLTDRKMTIEKRMAKAADLEGEISDPRLEGYINRLQKIFEKHPDLIDSIDGLFRGVTSETSPMNLSRDARGGVGSTIEGMTIRELDRFTSYMENISKGLGAREANKRRKAGDNAKLNWWDYFFEPDYFSKRFMDFDPRMITDERLIINKDGTGELVEVKAFTNTAASVHRTADRYTDFSSRDENRVFQELSDRMGFIEATGDLRPKIMQIVVGLREEGLGTDTHISAANKARADLAKLEKQGKEFEITIGDGKVKRLTAREMVEKVDAELTKFVEKFYNEHIGDPNHKMGLTKKDLAEIVWEDKANFIPDIAKTAEKFEAALQKGKRPPDLSMNAAFLLSRRHMINQLVVKKNPLQTDPEAQALLQDVIRQIDGLEVDFSGATFPWQIFKTEAYKRYKEGRLRSDVMGLFERVSEGQHDVRLGDLTPQERVPIERAAFEQLRAYDRFAAERLAYKPVGTVDFGQYWPHNAWPRSVLKKVKEERLARLVKAGTSKEELTKEELQLEIDAGNRTSPTGGIADAVGNMFMMDSITIKDLQQVGGINYRPPHSMSRSEGEPMPGYRKDMRAMKNYVAQMVKGKNTIMMSIINSHAIKRFEQSNVAGEYTTAWSRFLKIYNRNAIGAPTVFPTEWLKSPELGLKSGPYWMFTDEYYVNKMKKAAKRYGFEGPLTLGQKSFLAKRLQTISKLEGQYELITLLARTKTGIANIFGGSTNTWVHNGFDSFKKARDIQYLRNNVDPNIRSLKDAENVVAQHGAIESFIADDFQFSPKYTAKDASFIEAAKAIFKKRPFEDNWNDVLDVADKHGVTDKVLEAGSYFMRRTERTLRRDAWLASYIRAREVLKMTNTAEVPVDHPWLIEIANRGVQSSQFIYNNANRAAFARTSMGKIFARFQIWGWKSVKLRRDIYAKAHEANYRPGSEEFERLKRIMMADLFVVGLAKMFPFSIFESSTPPPLNWFVEASDWAFGDKEDKETAFFGIGPINIIAPPASRPLQDIFRLMMHDDWDRFWDYHMYTYIPFGLLARDTGKTIRSPSSIMERLGGIPARQMQQYMDDPDRLAENPYPGKR